MIDLNQTLIFQLAIILTLLVILTQIAFKPFLQVLERRKSRLEGAERKSRELQQRVAEMMERYQAVLSAAQAQGAAIREEIRRDGLARELEILQGAMEEANRLIQEIKAGIAREAESARRELRLRAQDLSREIAQKILGRGLR